MNILIDGYNLLKQLLSKHITDREREWFHERAREYAREKGHALYIVYDAGPYNRQTKETHGRVTTIYSGHKDSADDVIKDYLDRNVLKNLLVITTDRELNAYADQYGIPSIDSLDFYEFMKNRTTPVIAGYKKSSGQAKKLHPEQENLELDALMQEGTTILQYKQELEEDDDEGYDFSKKERRLMRVVKKL